MSDYETSSAVAEDSTAKVDANSSKDEKLLREIRDRYTYALKSWEDVREEAKVDRRYLLNDPWDPKDRKEREDAGRPCINHDELNQYINQYVNGLRQSPPGIKVGPADEGTDEKTAELQQDLTRSIEYESDASSGAYVGAAEDAAESSYGFFRVTREYVYPDPDPSLGTRAFDQQIRIKAIVNPDSVVYDPDCKQPDWSDARYAFVIDPIPRDDFERRYPKAQKTSFSADDAKTAPDWIQDKIILVAEYWKAEETSRTLYLLPDGSISDVAPKGTEKKNTKARTATKRSIVQYITNGVEILETRPQPGTIIPIIAVIGKEMYTDDDTGITRHLISLVRLARDPQMSLAYLNSLEMEEAGLTPKVPYVGYKGQFESDSEAWEEITKVPHAYIQADPVVDASSNQVLPLPRREQFTPNFAAYEVAKDSCRRAIQAAMGIMPLPTAAQRDSEKSGIALQRIQQQQNVGSFHFTANLHRAMRLCGKIIDEWAPVVYDTERSLTLTKPDGKKKIVKLNTAQPYDAGNGQMEQYRVTEAKHNITISVGPSELSAFQAASEFTDLLVNNLGQLPPPGTPAAKVLAESIRMKQLGPKGDSLAAIFDPPQNEQIPPQAQAMIQQAQQQMTLMQAEFQKLQQEKQAKVVENQFRAEIEKFKVEQETMREQNRQNFELQKMRIELEMKAAVAEITTKAQNENEREAFVRDVYQETSSQGHELEMQAREQQHEHDMAEHNATNQQVMAEQDQQNQLEQQAAQEPQQPSE
jgi:hypothetical protein